MVDLQVVGDRLVIELRGWHVMVALRQRLEVPLAHVVAAHPDPGLTLGFFDRFKLVGGYWPGCFAVGTFVERGDLVFFDVHDPARALVIELQREPYRRLVVEVPDPDATAREIRRHLGGSAHAAPA
jgi:hypothetical protein